MRRRPAKKSVEISCRGINRKFRCDQSRSLQQGIAANLRASRQRKRTNFKRRRPCATVRRCRRSLPERCCSEYRCLDGAETHSKAVPAFARRHLVSDIPPSKGQFPRLPNLLLDTRSEAFVRLRSSSEVDEVGAVAGIDPGSSSFFQNGCGLKRRPNCQRFLPLHPLARAMA